VKLVCGLYIVVVLLICRW